MTMSTGRTSLFSTPAWLRDLGFASWLLVGFVLIIIGVIWLLGQTSTIVMPVIVAAVLGAVVAPLVDAIARRGAPRAVGAGVVLLGLVAVALLVVFLVVHGISANSGDVSTQATKALDKVEGWLKDAGINPADAKEGVKKAAPEIRETLVSGVATGINGLTSVVFFLSFAALATFFVLKDAPVMSRFITRHMGLPVPVAEIVTREIAKGLRNYFTGVTIIAAFNAILVGMGALILGVPLAGTIAVVTFVTAYIPYIGAWTAGIFAFVLALGSQGAADAMILALVIFLANGLLQNLLQPFVFGATLNLNPLAVLIVTVGGGALFGMVGLTLAAPLTSAAVHISEALRARPEADAGDVPAAAGVP
ncbi:MAG TPA: AI-2E family transporter [Solirubrobacteraceae bacterium]|nr:AI-2E family transporter [Solirubrobacteraceae bacterium]